MTVIYKSMRVSAKNIKDGAGLFQALSVLHKVVLSKKKESETKYGYTVTESKVTALETALTDLKNADAAGEIDYSVGNIPLLDQYNAALDALEAEISSKGKAAYDQKPTLAAVKTDLAKTTAGSLGAVVNATVESNTKIAKKADLDAQALKINQTIQLINKETSNWSDSDIAPTPMTEAGQTAAQIYNIRATTYPYMEWGEDADPTAWCDRHTGDMYHVGAAKGSAGNEHTGKAFSFQKVVGTNNYTWVLRADNEGIKAYKELQEVTKPGGTLTQLEASVKTDAQNKANAAKQAAISAAATDATSKVNTAKTELNTEIGKKVATTDFNSFKATNTIAINTAKESAISTAATDAQTKANTAKADAIAAAKTETTMQVSGAKTELNTAISKKVDTTTFNVEVGKKLNKTELGSSVATLVSGTSAEATTVKNAVKDAMMADNLVTDALSGYAFNYMVEDTFKNGIGHLRMQAVIYRGKSDVTNEFASKIKWYVQNKGAAESTTVAGTGITHTITDPKKDIFYTVDE